MNKTSLPAKLRTVLGRKIKQLRKQGLLPANIYGKKVKSQAVSVDAKKFAEVFSKAGETGLLELELDGKKLPVLIHNVSYHPVTNQTLHADFYAVDLKEKVEANVPLLIIGESPAVKDKTGVLLINLDELHVEALPQDLPEKIEVDIANLVKLDDAIKVADLPVSDKIKILTLPDTLNNQPLDQVANYILQTYPNYHIPGLEYCKYIIQNPTKAPQALKDGNWHFFFGSLFRHSGGHWFVPYVRWGGSSFRRNGDWLAYSWHSDCRVVALEP